MERDPHNPLSERAIGLAMLGTILFCAASGTGVGVFFEQAAIGGLIGGAVGILSGLWIVPGLRDWLD